MCGITGFVNFEGIQNPKNVILEMTNAIVHRGPDSSGFYINNKDNVALGHRRLSIIDLSDDGHQPMHSKNNRYIIVFNGEIYNYLELKKILSEKYFSINWVGKSDTEVLLEFISHMGLKSALEKIRGMYAFALYDLENKLIYLVRDRLGEKPLYYGWSGNSFIFASEIKSFYNFPKFQKNLSIDALSLFFKHCYIPSSYCIYKNIYKLESASYVKIDISSKDKMLDKINSQKYWLPENNLNYEDFTNKELIENIEDKLQKSVKQQMRSDVPIGAFLSGGIDSSLVSLMMQKNSTNKINTFNVSFDESQFDESPYARRVADTIGSNHHEIKLNYKMALDTIPALGNIYDEPFSDSSQIPTFLISKEIKKHVTVALSGDGGDELFGGYNRYTSINKVYNILKLLPFDSKILLSHVIFSLNEKNWDTLNKKIFSKFSKNFSFSNFGHKMYRLGDRLKNCSNKMDLYKSFLSENYKNEIVVKNSNHIDVIDELITNNNYAMSDFTNFMMLLDSKMYLPDDILVKVDRASMSNSLESRSPFLDSDLVEFSYNIPSTYKIHKNNKKILLKKILNKYFDGNLFERPKAGFAIPLSQWLRGPLKSLLYDSIANLKTNNPDLLNFKLIDTRCDQHLKNYKNWDNFLWSLIIYNNWHENNL